MPKRVAVVLLACAMILVGGVRSIALAQTATITSNIGDANQTTVAIPMNQINGPLQIGELSVFCILYNRPPVCHPNVEIKVLQIVGTYRNTGAGMNHFRVALTTGPILTTPCPPDTQFWYVRYQGGYAYDHNSQAINIPSHSLVGHLTLNGGPLLVGNLIGAPIVAGAPSVKMPSGVGQQGVHLNIPPTPTAADLTWDVTLGPDDVMFLSNSGPSPQDAAMERALPAQPADAEEIADVAMVVASPSSPLPIPLLDSRLAIWGLGSLILAAMLFMVKRRKLAA